MEYLRFKKLLSFFAVLTVVLMVFGILRFDSHGNAVSVIGYIDLIADGNIIYKIIFYLLIINNVVLGLNLLYLNSKIFSITCKINIFMIFGFNLYFTQYHRLTIEYVSGWFYIGNYKNEGFEYFDQIVIYLSFYFLLNIAFLITTTKKTLASILIYMVLILNFQVLIKLSLVVLQYIKYQNNIKIWELTRNFYSLSRFGGLWKNKNAFFALKFDYYFAYLTIPLLLLLLILTILLSRKNEC